MNVPKIAILVYYLSSYSIGLLALFLGFLRYRAHRTTTNMLFILTTLCMTVIVVMSTLMNFTTPYAQIAGIGVLQFFNFIIVSAFTCLIPAFAHSVFKTRSENLLNTLFLCLGIGSMVFASLIALIPLPGVLGRLILAVKNIAILHSLLFALIHFKSAKSDELGKFLKIVSMGTIFLLPGLALSEIAPEIFRMTVPFRMEGAILLPIAYSFWGIVFIFIRAKNRLPGTIAIPPVNDDFMERWRISSREQEVMLLLLKGKSYKEIMDELSITMPTVKTHVSSIYRKTETTNKMQLSLLARQVPEQ